MDLPIDHFRLLGVSPTSDAQGVLHALQQRLNRVPDQGFTAETLAAREQLLRASADLLTDPQRRQLYETELTALAGGTEALPPALEVAFPADIAGLLLLLEAGQPLECFELAYRALQPPQAPALGSGREADLILLAGLACLAAAADLHRQRRYELAALILQQGLQLLQRLGQLPALRQQLVDELEGLRPFRVLDLLSRDLTATAERHQGLALLEELVQARGGLEGERDPQLPPAEFQAFFKQIRAFLTVQEQIDLFCRWAPQSAAADFLATTALTASGFAQRKPERIAAARERLLASAQPGTQPLLACLELLLGQVESAQRRFREGADAPLLAWAERQSSDPLAQVCAYCRDWLARDVLPGYRDLEADPDLEAYFADRDVQRWVEEHDEPEPPAASPANWPALSSGTSFGSTGPSSPGPVGRAGADAAANPFATWQAPAAPAAESPSALAMESPSAHGGQVSPALGAEGPSAFAALALGPAAQQLGGAGAGTGAGAVEGARTGLGPGAGGLDGGGGQPGSAWATGLAAVDPFAAGQPDSGFARERGSGESSEPDAGRRWPLAWPSPLAWLRSRSGQLSSLRLPELRLPSLNLPQLNLPPLNLPGPLLPLQPSRRSVTLAAATAIAAGLVTAVVLRARQGARPATPIPVQLPPEPSPARPPLGVLQPPAPAGSNGPDSQRSDAQGAAPQSPAAASPASPVPGTGASRRIVLPLQQAQPAEAAVQQLLEAWLAAKAAVLAGQQPAMAPANLAEVALIRQLQAERRADEAAGIRQMVRTEIESVQISERSDRQIAARVTLRYGERRQGAGGAVVGEEISGLTLRNLYIFQRGTDGTWRLASFQRLG